MTIKRFVVVMVVLFLALVGLISHGFAIDLLAGTDSHAGWEERELVVQKSVKDKNTVIVTDEPVGSVFIHQTGCKLKLALVPGENWELADTRIYVGTEPVPTAGRKLLVPVTASFPYRTKFSKTEKYHLLELDLVDDLKIDFQTMGDTVDLNICVYAQVRAKNAETSTSKKDNPSTENEDAWARGLDEGDTISYGDTAGYSLIFTLDEAAVEMFRKNVSKNPEFETTKAKIEILHYYVEARRANRDPVTLEYETILGFDEDGNVNATDFDYRNVVKPLVAVYAEEVPDTYYPDRYTREMTNLASDVIAAVSLDEGQTWKRTNLSRAADRSSFRLDPSSAPYYEQGFDFPGEVKKPNVKVQGNNIMVAWTSKFARSGNPTYSLPEFLEDENGEQLLDGEGNPIPHPYYEEDIWGVGGAQRSKDYTKVEDGFPDLEIPFSVVWVCRGFVEQDGTIVWMKPERLTSGRRDAEQVAVASSPAGFAIVWQEDPDGLRPGDGAGPGHGWSGATTNHKTDIWYTYILMEDFQLIDEEFVSGGDPKCDPEDDDKGGGRPKALVPMRLPVRLTDNDTLNTDNMRIDFSLLKSTVPETVSDLYPDADPGKLYVLYKNDLEAFEPAVSDYGLEYQNTDIEPAGCDDDCGGGGGQGIGSGEGGGSHQYGLAHPDLLWRYDVDPDNPYILFHEKTNNQGVIKYVAVTADGRLLDGDTGASRCNIMLQNYQKPDGSYSAWAIIGYEESKGTGSGPPERDGDEGCGCGDDDYEKLPGEGGGSDRYYPDRGKNVVYHSFDFQNPDVVSGGDILNPQEVEEYPLDSGVYQLSWLKDKDGLPLYDWKGEPLPNYENARRPRFIIQSKQMATAGKGADYKGTVMVSVFKMGREGKGRPADVMMVRWEASRNDPGNPYDFKYLATREFTTGMDGEFDIVDWQNLSSVTPIDYTVEYTTKEEPYNRIYNWEQTEENLMDYTWDEPGLNARAHRGFIRGDFLAIAYVYTPNWRQARNGHDIYNCYVRRSFDGGKTWTTDPLGDGVTSYEIMKDLEGNRYVETYDLVAGEFEPARNISLFKNNKEIAIEPRLVGMPGTTNTVVTDLLKELVPDLQAAVGTSVVLFDQDRQNPDSFWMTYGTEETPYKDDDGEWQDGEPVDLYYSFSTDRGESFFTEEEPTFLNSDTNEEHPFYNWNWLAKDKRGIEIEQAESQIRYLPDGSVFYAIWNESSEEGSDAIFRRIFRAALEGDIINIKVNPREGAEE
jgi:hypothetical protein